MSPQFIHVSDIEQALNYLRKKHPSADGFSLSAPVRSLAGVYGLMAYFRQQQTAVQAMPEKAYAAWLEWYETTPDTPCIAICSTSQGDAVCKGCGRTFEEVKHWQEMSPARKRQTWHRIDAEQVAWRYNRYAERADGAAQAGLFAAFRASTTAATEKTDRNKKD